MLAIKNRKKSQKTFSFINFSNDVSPGYQIISSNTKGFVTSNSGRLKNEKYYFEIQKDSKKSDFIHKKTRLAQYLHRIEQMSTIKTSPTLFSQKFRSKNFRRTKYPRRASNQQKVKIKVRRVNKTINTFLLKQGKNKSTSKRHKKKKNA
ncbi:hypothetical protein M0812_01706 [Anaeramoeba flamelloides]|uniref:Uncharacterized protein n=1 Tax=Anaeramoeba flamelloides TaxID=1746091 RepID=A0AAV7YXP3_9EUKA|nr:hypothetical protein M0812_01706 [Anaeramoeba flamelloides]